MARTVTSHLTEQASLHKVQTTKLASKIPLKLPKLAARRREDSVEKVMPSASNVEKVGIPLPKVKVKEKVEKRGKYLKAVVDSLLGLGQGKVRSYAAIVSRMQIDFPDFPWDNRPVIKKHLGMALKAGVEQGILVQQDWLTGKGSGCYKLSREELKKIQSNSVSCGGGKKRIDVGAGTEVDEEEIGMGFSSLEAEESLNLNIKKVMESDEE